MSWIFEKHIVVYVEDCVYPGKNPKEFFWKPTKISQYSWDVLLCTCVGVCVRMHASVHVDMFVYVCAYIHVNMWGTNLPVTPPTELLMSFID